MRKSAHLLIAAISIFAAAHAGDFNLAEPAPGLFVHTGRNVAVDAPGHDDIANIGFIVGSRCVAIVDTGGSVSVGRALRAAVRVHTQLPICYVINTHVHFDHVLGNFAFKDEQAHFIGSANLAGAMRRSQDFFVSHYSGDLDPTDPAGQIIGPDQTVDHELAIDLGQRSLRLRAWPISHTDCDLTVEDSRSGTLWSGDLLFRERLPVVDGSAKGWLGVIDSLTQLHVRRVIPGHGSLSTNLAAAFAPERSYLQALIDGIRADVKQGMSMQAALDHGVGESRGHWLLWDETQPRNIARAWQELEWE